MSLSKFGTILAAAGTLGVITAAPAQAEARAAVASEPAAVGQVDVERYLGSWFQVAAVPQLFEIQCAKNAKAAYSLTAKGTIGVRNTCTTWLNTTSAVTVEAKALDASNARLNVSFLKFGDSYLHTRDANYIVTGLDPAYGWALVTDSDRRSGFVLSRSAALTEIQRAAVREAIRKAGLDACDFRTTRQDEGERTSSRLC